MGGQEERCRDGPLRGANIDLDPVSVTATENILMAAVLAEGITTVSNAAKEPEVVDLAKCLNKMGANIKGEGSDKIIVEAVSYTHLTLPTICSV